MHRTVIDEDLIIECIKESRQSELEAKDDDNNNSSSYNKNNKTSASLVNVNGDDINITNNDKNDKNRLLDDDGEAIDFTKINKLSLSFRDIYKIDHLRGFENLVQLRLDNNLIETIENLSHLVNLEWLDLSFNNISKIEGLECLQKLTDLCLVNNFIKKIENLENNKNLQVLSLGNNCIENIDDNILYLRQFENLQALNLKGNPIYDEKDFKTYIFAYCQNLKFLDYQRVKENEVIQAKLEKETELTEIEGKEQEIKSELKQKQEEKDLNELLTNANISGVNTLFDDMVRDDSEMLRLQNLPGFQAKLDELSVNISKMTEKYVKDVIAVYNEKLKEDEILNKTLCRVSFESETYSIEIITKFQNEGINELTEKILNSTSNQEEIDKIVKEKLKEISNILMDSEMQCVEKINFIINAYEDRITDLMKKNLNNAESYFAEITGLENDNHEKLLELISKILEKIKTDGIDEVIEALPENEALRNMIMDKDAINNSLSLSHDNHMSHIGRLEDTVRDREEKQKKDKMEKQNNIQYKRNRQRISEILIFIEKYAKQFNVKME